MLLSTFTNSNPSILKFFKLLFVDFCGCWGCGFEGVGFEGWGVGFSTTLTVTVLVCPVKSSPSNVAASIVKVIVVVPTLFPVTVIEPVFVIFSSTIPVPHSLVLTDAIPLLFDFIETSPITL